MADVTVKQEHRYILSLTEEEAVMLRDILYFADEDNEFYGTFSMELLETVDDALNGT